MLQLQWKLDARMPGKGYGKHLSCIYGENQDENLTVSML